MHNFNECQFVCIPSADNDSDANSTANDSDDNEAEEEAQTGPGPLSRPPTQTPNERPKQENTEKPAQPSQATVTANQEDTQPKPQILNQKATDRKPVPVPVPVQVPGRYG